MPAYLIGHIVVKDPVQWDVYVEGVRSSLVPFGARVLFRGRRASVLAGEHPYDLTVVIEFSDQGTLQSWYRSEEYQKLIPIRDRAAEVAIISYDA